MKIGQRMWLSLSACLAQLNRPYFCYFFNPTILLFLACNGKQKFRCAITVKWFLGLWKFMGVQTTAVMVKNECIMHTVHTDIQNDVT